ncbi:hypothetical protein IQ274_27800 [Nostoc sp. LEGE 12447]|uniref:hypothetical protein n=1 Tax=Nostoc sp. LEGE 12447 TaxID=1828640 RepID=UPI001883C9EA|nr:hypothetical protein [Nostoc sp. LEGE 12447]MBE9001902.1 hypothetical protein [Nostoc sp. LEGE 12447]
MLSNHLYNLLPVIYRQRDAEQGYPLRDLLQAIAQQANIVEADITQLYENWFIETCEDWVVPYIADLIGYRPVNETGDITTPQGQQRNKILIPRREVANTIRYRRRKGTLALLELLANDVAGWPARAVEFYKLLAWTQHLNHLRPTQGKTVDLRQSNALELLDSPFDTIAHTVDIRPGGYNLPHVGVFIWRLKTYSVTKTPAYCVEEISPNCYTFSVLGNDTQLYNKPQPETEPTHIAQEINLPGPIRRLALKLNTSLYYGKNQSLQIFLSPGQQPIDIKQIALTDLSDWQYRPALDTVAVDPVLGRIVFPARQLPKGGVWVSYHYAFSTDIGGGEYNRTLFHPMTYRVGKAEQLKTINDAINQWRTEIETHPHAVIEIADSGVYTEPFNISLEANHSLQIRAANYYRPIIRLLDYQAETTDALNISVQAGSRFTLDGLLIFGRGVRIQQDMEYFPVPGLENKAQTPNEVSNFLPVKITIRHCTLVPGWALHCDCEPKRPAEPSLELFNLKGQVEITHSIVGSIQVNQDEVQTEPVNIYIRDSILDATSIEQEAIGAPGYSFAHARLTIQRCTVFGQILVHNIALAENSIFDGLITVARRQKGCMRFCYVTPNSRTPRRYNCQPDLVAQVATDDIKQVEINRVHPQFNSTRYGNPRYCQLAKSCAVEIKRGADDESEMGVFHHLYQPQREANLRTRLDEYTPANMSTEIIFVN